MSSIRNKLFVQIGIVIISLITILTLANTYLLPMYYMNREKNQLQDYYDKINSHISTDYDDLLQELVFIENKSNVDILIYDNEGGIVYASKSSALDKTLNKLLKDLETNTGKPPRPPIKINRVEIIDDNTRFLWADDVVSKTKSLILEGSLENGLNIDLSSSLLAIATSVDLANQFLFFTGVPLFFVGIILAYLLSRSFTKPILQMNKATNQLKKLDFDTRCEVLSNDEIGQLANSINEMSIELASTIESLNTSNEKLQGEIAEKIRIDDKRKQLLNNVSHELKTPLALMQGYAEGLKLNVARDREKVDFYCDVIVDETKKMNHLVQGLLDINQIEFGDKVLHKTEFEIVDFVQYIVKKFERQFEQKGIKLVLQVIDTVDVHGDMLKVEQVLTNYLTNAIQYVDENKKVKVELLNVEGHVRLEVFNSCSDIEEDELEKLWGSFYKRDEARTRREGSHGLGLSIVKAIQEAHHNDYGVRLVDGGIVFWFDVDLLL